jgi:hypothetical protein
MTSLVHNIAPTRNAARPHPLDCRPGGSAPVAALARQFKLTANSSLSEADLIDLGEPRLRELLGMAANAQRLTQSQPAPAPAPAPVAALLGGYAGYSMNAIMDSVTGTTDADLLRLATEVYSLILGSNGDRIAELGEAQLKALKAHFEQT